MSDYRWLNPSHPQTLQTATLLLYLDGVLTLLHLSFVQGGVLVCLGMIVGAFGMANDKRWGYGLAVAAAVINVVLLLLIFRFQVFTNIFLLLDLMFSGALVALLLHPMSRSYQRIWFR